MLLKPLAEFRKRILESSRRRHRRRKPNRQVHRKALAHLETLEDRTMLSHLAAWAEQGPAPIVRNDGSFNAGAIEVVAAHPRDADTIYVGTVNGGVWATEMEDAIGVDPFWEPLMQDEASLSIGDLAFAPWDCASGLDSCETLFAGTGNFSSFGREGGAPAGVFKTEDGGETWSNISRNSSGDDEFGDSRLHIRSIVPTNHSEDPFSDDHVILAAAIDRFGSPDKGGVFRSVDEGRDWVRISGTSGGSDGIDNDGDGAIDEIDGELNLPEGSASHLIADPGQNGRYFAAIPGQGVFRSEDYGQTWESVSAGLDLRKDGFDNDSDGDVDEMDSDGGEGIEAADRIEVSARHYDGFGTVLYAALIDFEGEDNKLRAVFRSTIQGDIAPRPGDFWRPVQNLPDTGGQANIHFAMVADPEDPNVLFVRGQTGGFRLTMNDANPDNDSSETIVGSGANGTHPHADARDLVFDADGNLLDADDGGIYRLLNPNDADEREWEPLHGNMRITEVFAVGLDSLNDLYVAGTQDNGTVVQGLGIFGVAGGKVIGGDGNVVEIDNSSPDTTIQYVMGNNLHSFRRRVVDTEGQPIEEESGPVMLADPDTPDERFSGLIKRDDEFDGPRFTLFPYVLNNLNGHRDRMLISGLGTFYESDDRGDTLTDLTDLLDLNADQRDNDGDRLEDENGDGTIDSDDLIDENGDGKLDFRDINENFADANGDGEFDADDLSSDRNGDGSIDIRDVNVDEGDEFACVRAMSYGGRLLGSEFPDLTYIGTTGVQLDGEEDVKLVARLNRTQQNPIDDFLPLTAFPGGTPRDIAVDPQNAANVFVTGSRNVFMTEDAGLSWTNITGDLALRNLWDIEVARNSGTDGETVVWIAGFGGVATTLSPTDADTSWTEYPQGLPNVLIRDLNYEPPADPGSGRVGDVLLAGALGRGVWRFDNASRRAARDLQPGRISAVTFHDLNANGERDIINVDLSTDPPTVEQEPGLSGWSAGIDLNENGVIDFDEPSTSSDGEGRLTFPDLIPGHYTVDLTPPSSAWMSSTHEESGPVEITAEVTLDPGETVNLEFGNFQLGEISGTKFNDADVDGERDFDETGSPTEPGVQDYLIYVDENQDGNFNGNLDVVHADDVPKTIPSPAGPDAEETETASVIEVTDDDLSGLDTTISDLDVWIDLSHPDPSELQVGLLHESPTEEREGLNFFFGSESELRNLTFDDDGHEQRRSLEFFEGRSAVGTWTLFVIDRDPGNDGTLMDWSLNIATGDGELATVTDAEGRYELNDLTPGMYRIAEEERERVAPTMPPDGNQLVPVTSAETAPGVDFGNAFFLVDPDDLTATVVGFDGYDEIEIARRPQLGLSIRMNGRPVTPFDPESGQPVTGFVPQQLDVFLGGGDDRVELDGTGLAELQTTIFGQDGIDTLEFAAPAFAQTPVPQEPLDGDPVNLPGPPDINFDGEILDLIGSEASELARIEALDPAQTDAPCFLVGVQDRDTGNPLANIRADGLQEIVTRLGMGDDVLDLAFENLITPQMGQIPLSVSANLGDENDEFRLATGDLKDVLNVTGDGGGQQNLPPQLQVAWTDEMNNPLSNISVVTPSTVVLDTGANDDLVNVISTVAHGSDPATEEFSVDVQSLGIKSLLANLGDGDDRFLTERTDLFDLQMAIAGQAGDDLIVSGQGDDLLDGGEGFDVLIAGPGTDQADGGDGEDIVIGGTTIHDDNPVALGAIRDFWANSQLSLEDRARHLAGLTDGPQSHGPFFLIPGQTVFDDGEVDDLTFIPGEDWLFEPCTVTNTNDSGPGSLRAAIGCANAAVLPLQARIVFEIPTTDPGFTDVDSHLAGDPAADPGVRDAFVINPISELPALDNAFGHGITLDARTQTDFTGDTNPFGPEIVLDGSRITDRDFLTGLFIRSDGNRVSGLNIQQFDTGILPHSGGLDISGDDNWIDGNYIGTDATGRLARPNDSGIILRGDSILIGTNGDGSNDEVERNVISTNLFHGVDNGLFEITDNVIAGNYIGTDATGISALGNRQNGILFNATDGNRIGTDGNGMADAAERNLISANEGWGVRTIVSDDNVIAGNYIGTDVTGSNALGNQLGGVELDNTSQRNLVGTDGNGEADRWERNLISGNEGAGVRISDVGDQGTRNNVVAGNYIGTDVTGLSALGNGEAGVMIDDQADTNIIGTDSSSDIFNANERNLIAGNLGNGVEITGSGTDNNLVAGNFIGTDRTGEVALPNHENGVFVGDGAADNYIGNRGSTLTSARRQIVVAQESEANLGDFSDNILGTIGVFNTEGFTVEEYYGFNRSPGSAFAPPEGEERPTLREDVAHMFLVSAADGLGLFHVYDNLTSEDRGNRASTSYLLSGDTATFLAQDGPPSGADGYSETGGTEFEASHRWGNRKTDGLAIGTLEGDWSMTVEFTPIETFRGIREWIGIGADGSEILLTPVPGRRVQLRPAPVAAAGNVISGNGDDGVKIKGVQTTGNIVAGNFIGTDKDGREAVPNQEHGVFLADGAQENHIGVADDGETSSVGNLISGNGADGVRIESDRAAVNSLSVVDRLISGDLPSVTSTALIDQTDLRDPTGPAGHWSFDNPIPGGGGDDYAVVTRGFFQVNTAGTFSFAHSSDDGGRLRIDGSDVIVDDATHTFRDSFGDVALSAGVHTFEWVAFERRSAAGFELSVAVGADRTGPITPDNGWHVVGDLGSVSEIEILQGPLPVTAYYSEPAGGRGNTVAGNYIGTDITGNSDVGNADHGVNIRIASRETLVGTDADGLADIDERNVVSGNDRNGIIITGTGTDDNVVAGNFVGTTAAGTASLENSRRGVVVSTRAERTRIGTKGTSLNDQIERNVISGNQAVGVLIRDGSSETVVAGNFIGTDANGFVAIPNGARGGVRITSRSHDSRVGTDGNGQADFIEGNLISGSSRGILIDGSGTDHNVVAGNFIGTDLTGSMPLGNSREGIRIAGGASNNFVGSDGSAPEDQRNHISGNAGTGVEITGVGTTANIIAGNFIGTDEEGTTALPNGGHGVAVTEGAFANRIGLAEFDSGGNVIAGNRGNGVFIAGTGTEENVVVANSIGVGAKGDRLIGNGAHGVLITDDAAGNRVGSDADGKLDDLEGNEIAGNRVDGVRVLTAASDGNSIRRNAIHSNVGLGIDLGGDGVTRNDRRDRDSGPNELQNFPEFRAILTGRGLGLRGRLDSAPETEFIIDIYANSERDPSGHGEGERWLGSFTVNTNRDGIARINELLAVSVGPDEVVTATATDPVGNTSEFSAAETVRGRVVRERKRAPIGRGKGTSILFVDEADSEFRQPGDVRDARDRFVNRNTEAPREAQQRDQTADATERLSTRLGERSGENPFGLEELLPELFADDLSWLDQVV